MKVTKLISFLLVCVLLISVLSACGSSGTAGEAGSGKASGSGFKIAVVPKFTSTGWFQRMEEGVNAYNDEHGTEYFYGGSTEPSGQVAYVEQLLAEDWDAICIVPFDPDSIAPLLQKARDEGIVVIAHEAEQMDSKYFDYAVEAFASPDLGRHYGELLVENTGGEGTYIQFVGSLNSVNHMTWCDAADEYIAENSNLVKLGRYETNDDMTNAYNQTKELMQAHPEITAIQCSSSTDLPGAARAVEELGLSGKVTLLGTSLASLCGEYVKSGTICSFSLWDPYVSGQAMIALAEKVLSEGDSFDPTTCSLPMEGYREMTLEGNTFFGSARADVTAENLGDFDF